MKLKNTNFFFLEPFFPWGLFAPTVLSTVHFFFSLVASRSFLRFSSGCFISITSPFLFIAVSEFVMVCFEGEASTLKKDHICFANCTRYITPTPWSSFSVFSVHWKRVAFGYFGNHEFVKKSNLSAISPQLCAFLCFMGILHF